jgi:hypothetical protein
MNRRRTGTMLVLALVAAAIFAASAFAGSNGTLCKVYCKKGTSVQKQTGKGTPTGGDANSGGTLPFTGLDLGFIALAGVVLVFAGVGLHRLTRKPPEPPAT